MNNQTYAGYLQDRYGFAGSGVLTDFLSRKNERLLLGDTVDLEELAAQYGAPLEVSFCPLITQQIERMNGYAEIARLNTEYAGQFLYAYATKANFSEEVVRTALDAGAHYETSAAADVVIAHHLWRQGVLDEQRYIFCNGSKERSYLDGILALRHAGYERVVVVVDDLEELESLIAECREPLLLGVRERHAADVVDQAHSGGERFGLTPAEVLQAVERIRHTEHQIIVYHAMVGSQIEDAGHWQERLERSVRAFAAIAQTQPSLTMFNFGGGMPTSGYDLAFEFDYTGFLTQLMSNIARISDRYGIAHPTVVAECGRYTVANHVVYLIEVGTTKVASALEQWYLINGSLMVSAPDTLVVDQEFVVLPLNNWNAALEWVRLGGRRTCDSDDMYPRPHQAPLALPRFEPGMVVAVFGVGAYQAMISGRGGAHHCLNPEMRRLIIEQDGSRLVVTEVPPQSLQTIMSALGYNRNILEPVSQPRYRDEYVERLPVTNRTLRAGRRRQSAVRTSAARVTRSYAAKS